MYLKQKENVMFRNYDSFGYITDNRNFGYTQTINNRKDIGDKIVSQSGAVFLSVLGRNPQTLDELAMRIKRIFIDTDVETIKKDAKDFYCLLENDGFIVSGETLQECNENDRKFSYKEFEPNVILNNNLDRDVCIEKSTQEYFEEYFKGEQQLVNIHIEITSRCNERCVHCYIPHEDKISDIETGLFYDILNQSKEMNLLHLTLSGGEPLMHRSICDFLEKCNEYNFSVRILSNLTLLNNEIVTEMKKNRLLTVQTSLYSMEPNIHEQITQTKGSFEKTKKAILTLIENDIPLQISCPIMKENKDCYDDVVNWAKKNKINVGDDYVIIAKYNHAIENLNCRLTVDEVKEIISNKMKNDISLLEHLEREAENKQNVSPDDIVCSICNSSICIADNGNVYPCAGWQDYTVGNVKERFLKDIWEKSIKVNYLRGLRKKDFPKCNQCSDKEYCTMCMIRNANENPLGDPLVVNEYFCNIAKVTKTLVLEWKHKLNTPPIR